jgi:hypothetical protein
MDAITAGEPIAIMSHPSQVWPATAYQPAARHLHMHETGRMLAISRGNPLRAAAERMSQEGYGPATTLVIKDADGIAPDQSATIAEALA